MTDPFNAELRSGWKHVSRPQLGTTRKNARIVFSKKHLNSPKPPGVPSRMQKH